MKIIPIIARKCETVLVEVQLYGTVSVRRTLTSIMRIKYVDSTKRWQSSWDAFYLNPTLAYCVRIYIRVYTRYPEIRILNGCFCWIKLHSGGSLQIEIKNNVNKGFEQHKCSQLQKRGGGLASKRHPHKASKSTCSRSGKGGRLIVPEEKWRPRRYKAGTKFHQRSLLCTRDRLAAVCRVVLLGKGTSAVARP